MKVIGEGVLKKMQSRLETPVSYKVPLGDSTFGLNQLINTEILVEHTGKIFCVECGRKTNKSFNQGYCYPCFQKLQDFFVCLIHPEKCRCDEGDCLQDHIVYLANSSGLKIGITRATQVPTRWIDQGATQALPIMRVRSRYQSGAVEVLFKQHVADKTNWRSMLKGVAAPLNMKSEAESLIKKCESEIEELKESFGIFGVNILTGVEPVNITYPINESPQKIFSYNLDKEPLIQDKLLGIKGQYLIFENGVINLRKFSGYEVRLSC